MTLSEQKLRGVHCVLFAAPALNPQSTQGSARRRHCRIRSHLETKGLCAQGWQASGRQQQCDSKAKLFLLLQPCPTGFLLLSCPNEETLDPGRRMRTKAARRVVWQGASQGLLPWPAGKRGSCGASSTDRLPCFEVRARFPVCRAIQHCLSGKPAQLASSWLARGGTQAVGLWKGNWGEGRREPCFSCC